MADWNTLLCIGWVLSRGNRFNAAQKISRVITIAALIANSKSNVFQDNETLAMLKSFTLETFGANRAVAIIT